MVFHLHQCEINRFDVAQSLLTIGNGRLVVLWKLVVGLRPLQIEERSRSFRVAECNLAQATFHNKLSRLGSGFGSFNGTLNLLLHPLHMVVSTAAIPASSKSVIGLEKVSLSECVRRLLRVLTRSTTNLAEDLVIEIFSNGSFWAFLIQVSSCSHQLL